jgi:hypothetical protein
MALLVAQARWRITPSAPIRPTGYGLRGIVGKRLTYRSPLINSRPASEQKPWRHPRFKARRKAKN